MPDKPNDAAALTQKILAGARGATALRLIGQVISWGSTIIVVRHIAPQDYGLYAMLEAPLELLLMLSVLGLEIALVRVKTIELDALRSSFGLLLITSLVCGALMFFGAPVLAKYFNQDSLRPLAQVMSIVFLLTPFRVIPNALLDRDLLFKSRAQLELVSKVASAATTLGLAVAGYGVWALALGVLVDRCLYALLVMIRHPWFIRPSFQFRSAYALLAFGGVSMVSTVAVLLAGKGAILVAAPILGVQALGLYALANEFARMPLTKVMPVINPLLIPAFAQFLDQPAVAAKHLEKALLVTGTLLMPVAIGLTCLAEPFVISAFGQRWVEAALPMALLSLATPVRMVSLMSRAIITTFGKPHLVLAVNVITLAIVLPGSYFAAPYGALGLVAVWILADVVSEVVAKQFLGRLLPCGWRELGSALMPPLVSCLVMAVLLVSLRWMVVFPSSLVELAAGVILGGIAYLAAYQLLFPRQLRFVYSLILNR